MKHRLKHRLEYAVLRVSVGILRALPYPTALFVAYLMAWLWYHAVRFRPQEARKRVLEVFGDRFSEREVRRITWLSWRNFVFCAVDLIRLPLMSLAWIRSHVVNYEEASRKIRERCMTGRGAIVACPHMGAWEMAGVTMQLLGLRIFFITGRQKNPLVDAFLNRLRRATGIAALQRGSSMLRSVVHRLRNGEVLALLPDVPKSEGGVRVRFLGREADVVEGMAFFARHADVPIVPVIVTRRGWSNHHIRFCEPILPDPRLTKREDWQRMVQETFRVIEEAIREEPEQWFWFNKRWILARPEPA